MPNGVKYSTTTPSGSLRRDNVALGVNGNLGPTANTGFYSMPTPASGKYIINKVAASGVPNFFAPQNDTELIQFARNEGATGADTGSAAAVLSWIATQANLEAANFEYPNIVTDGLVLNVDAGFVGSYPTTGTTLYDLSGNANNGALINGPTFNSANSGSIVFDGVDDYGRVTNCVNALPQDITIEVWLKGTIDPFNNAFEIGGGGSSIANELVARGSNGALNYLQYFSWYEKTDLTTNNFISIVPNAGMPISPTQFSQHVVWLKGDGTSGTYLNGSLFASNATPTSFTRWYIAYRDLYFGFGIENIAVIRIYNRALPAQEVLQNYNAQKGRFGL
jgi:hypothetical protein